MANKFHNNMKETKKRKLNGNDCETFEVKSGGNFNKFYCARCSTSYEKNTLSMICQPEQLKDNNT